MLEVVFSDSVKGAMKIAKNFDEKNFVGGVTAYIGEKPKRSTQEKRFEGKALGGSPEDVVFVGFSLDIGDISGEIDGQERQDVYENIMGHRDIDKLETEHFFRHQNADLRKLLAAATQGTPIRIWKSSAPFSACGFVFVCDVLRNIDCSVCVVSLPECVVTAEDTITSYVDWNEIFPGQLYTFLSYEQPLSTIEKQLYGDLWQKLKKENSLLRAVVNGALMSVPANFYDHLIHQNLPDTEFVMARLIGQILSQYQIGVGDWWYCFRLERMIEENLLTVIADGDPSHPYGKVLMKVVK